MLRMAEHGKTMEQDRLLKPHDFLIVNDNIGTDWIALAVRLLKYPDIQVIEADCKTYTIKYMAFVALTKWQQQQPEVATVQTLVNHLREIGRQDIANKILFQSGYSQSAVNTQNGNFSDCFSMGHSSNSACHLLDGSKVKFPSMTSRPVSRALLMWLSQDFSEDAFLRYLKQKLKNCYKTKTMCACPWMENQSTPVGFAYIDRHLERKKYSENETQPTEMLKNIFSATESQKTPSRILIEGLPGSGKTSLLAKLAYDWGYCEPYIQHFELVFVLNVRNASGNFEDMLSDAVGYNTTPEEKHHLMNIYSSRPVLLLLDGFDEASTVTKHTLLNQITSETWNNADVIMTSLPVESVHGFINKSLLLKGLNDQQQKQFLEKSLCPNILKHVEDLQIPNEFLQSPRFLLFLVIVVRKWEAATKPRTKTEPLTKTEFYKEVCNLYLRRFVSTRHNDLKLSDLSIDIPLKNVAYANQHTADALHLFTQISQFALQAVEDNRSCFNTDYILTNNNNKKRDQRILELGILQPTVRFTISEVFLEYQPIGKLMLEFLAAYGLKSALYANSHNWSDKISLHGPKPSTKSSFVFPFLIGLLGDKSDCAFRALQSFKPECTGCFSSLIECLLETNMTEKILSILRDFLPEEWKIKWRVDDNGFSQSNQHERLLSYGITENRIRHVTWNLKYHAQVPKDKTVNILQVEIRNEDAVERDHVGLLCEELWCHLHSSEVSEANVVLLEELYLNCDHMSFHLDCFSSNAWLRCIQKVSEDCNLPLNIQCITCTIGENLNGLLSMLTSIISNNNVEEVEITLSSNGKSEKSEKSEIFADILQNTITELVKSAGKSKILKRFRLKDSRPTDKALTVDLSHLCNDRQKSWEWLQLEDVTVCCTQSNVFAIQYLNVASANLKITGSELNSFCMTAFVCPLSFLERNEQMTEFCNKQITELYVEYDQHIKSRRLSALLISLENLKLLSISLTSCTTHLHKNNEFESWFCDTAGQTIELKGLEICFIQRNYRLASTLIGDLVSCLQKSVDRTKPKLNLNYLTLQVETAPEACTLNYFKAKCFGEMITVLKEPLKEKLLSQLLLVCCHNSFPDGTAHEAREFIPLEKLFASNDGFIFDHYVWGLKDATTSEKRDFFDRRYSRWLFDQDHGFYRVSRVTVR